MIYKTITTLARNFLGNFITKSKRSTLFTHLTDKEKILMMRFFRTPDTEIFKEILLGWNSALMKDLVASENEKEAHKIRGSIATITRIRQFMEQARVHEPKKD